MYNFNKKFLNKKQEAQKIIRDYLKPSCDEELSQEDYPEVTKE